MACRLDTLASGLKPTTWSRTGGIEQDDLVGAVFGNQPHQRLGQIAVRVDEADALALTEVADDQVLEERRLAHAGLADDVEMTAAVVVTEGDESVVVAETHRRDPPPVRASKPCRRPLSPLPCRTPRRRRAPKVATHCRRAEL